MGLTFERTTASSMTGPFPKGSQNAPPPQHDTRQETGQRAYDIFQMCFQAKENHSVEERRRVADKILNATNFHTQRSGSRVRSRSVQTRLYQKLAFVNSLRSRLNYFPNHEDDVELAQEMTHRVNHVLSRIGFDRQHTLAVLDALKYGDGFLKVYFDPGANGGLGDFAVRQVHRDFVAGDPMSYGVDNARVWTQISAMPRDLVADTFGYRPDALESMISDPALASGSSNTDSFSFRSANTTGRILGPNLLYSQEELVRRVPEVFKNKVVQVIEVWTITEEAHEVYFGKDGERFTPGFHDKEIETYKQKGWIESVRLLRNPRVQRTVALGGPSSVGLAVIDGTDIADHGMIPFVQIKNYPDTEPWSEGEPALIGSLQTMENVILNSMVTTAMKMGFPRMLIPEGIFKKGLTDEIGTVYPFRDPVAAAQVRDIQPSPLPSYMMQLLQYGDRKQDDNSGQQQIGRGINPTQVQSGKQASLIDRRSRGRDGLFIRGDHEAIERMGRMLPSLIQKFTPSGQQVRTMDPMTGEFSFVPFNPKQKNKADFDVEVIGFESELERQTRGREEEDPSKPPGRSR